MPNQKQNNKSQKKTKQKKQNNKQNVSASRVVTAPVSYGVINTTRPATFNGSQHFRLRRREFIGDVVSDGSTLFSITNSYKINPGSLAFLPWGAKVSTCFEQYHINSMTASLSTSGNTGRDGRMFVVADFDAGDAAPVDKRTLYAKAGSKSVPIWTPQVRCPLPPNRLSGGRGKKYVRSDEEVIPAYSTHSYDCGTLYVGIQGVVATGPVAELWIEYDISLFIPSEASELKQTVTNTAFAESLANTPIAQGSQTFLRFGLPAATNGIPGFSISGSGDEFICDIPGTYEFDFNGTFLKDPGLAGDWKMDLCAEIDGKTYWDTFVEKTGGAAGQTAEILTKGVIKLTAGQVLKWLVTNPGAVDMNVAGQGTNFIARYLT